MNNRNKYKSDITFYSINNAKEYKGIEIDIETCITYSIPYSFSKYNTTGSE